MTHEEAVGWACDNGYEEKVWRIPKRRGLLAGSRSLLGAVAYHILEELREAGWLVGISPSTTSSNMGFFLYWPDGAVYLGESMAIWSDSLFVGLVSLKARIRPEDEIQLAKLVMGREDS